MSNQNRDQRRTGHNVETAEPQFTDASPVRLNPDESTPSEDDTNKESQIVHKEIYMDGTVQKTREHGPMPVSEWAAYEKEHGL